MIGGFRRDPPKAHILKVREKVLQPRLVENFDDMSGLEAYCPYLLSSVLFLRCGSPREARAAVGFLRASSLRVKLNNEELSLWFTLQKTKEQKDRSKRLMRMAACVQANFLGNITPTETFKFVCWKSGSIVALDMRIAKLVFEKVSFFDDWWALGKHKETVENT